MFESDETYSFAGCFILFAIIAAVIVHFTCDMGILKSAGSGLFLAFVFYLPMRLGVMTGSFMVGIVAVVIEALLVIGLKTIGGVIVALLTIAMIVFDVLMGAGVIYHYED